VIENVATVNALQLEAVHRQPVVLDCFRPTHKLQLQIKMLKSPLDSAMPQ